MMRFLFLSVISIMFTLNSQAQVVLESDSVKVNQMYLVWNNDSQIRDSLQMKKAILHYDEARYLKELVSDGLVKQLLSVERLPRFKKGDENLLMFLFDDPLLDTKEMKTLATISFQGNAVLADLVNEMSYVTLDLEFRPLINVEFMPSFEGGYNAMVKYLNNEVDSLGDVDLIDEFGAVTLGFVVDEKGSLADVKILESYNEILDKEAFRLIESMPRWQAGRHGGDFVSVFVVLQLIFKI